MFMFAQPQTLGKEPQLVHGDKMSFIIKPQEVEKTHEEKRKEYVDELRVISGQMHRMIEEYHTRLFQGVWFADNFTSAEILEEIGTDGVQLFQDSSGVQTLLARNNPEYVVLTPPVEVTLNEDGTVSVDE